MIAPSGDQFEIAASGYRAVVTECGAGLRLLEYDGRALVDGYDPDVMAPAGAGQLLLPWPNRIAGGRYRFDGRDLSLAISEPALGNAAHGLTRWVAWSLEEMTDHAVSLLYRLMAQPGYPWTVDLHVLYDLSANGLTVTVTATNMSGSPAPYAQGAHPYLTVGDDGIDDWQLTVPADTRLRVDAAMIPAGREAVEGPTDFREPAVLAGRSLDTAYTGLSTGAGGLAEVTLRHRERGVTLWMDQKHRWVQLFSGDSLARPRRALAVEPMTAPPNAFNTGEDLVVLAPAGSPGDEHSSSWGIRVS